MNQATQCLTHVDEQKEMLLHLVGHNLAGNLSALTLAMDVVRDDPGSMPALSASIRETIEDCRSIVHSLQSVIRLDGETLPWHRHRSSLTIAFHEALSYVSGVLEGKRLTVAFEMGYEGLVCADHSLLVQVVLYHAIRYMARHVPKGSVITVQSVCEDDVVEIRLGHEVSPSEEASRINEVLQAEGGKEGRDSCYGDDFGTCLEMRMIRRIVEGFGGQLLCSSELPRIRIRLLRKS